jgi:hypothetical protein
MAEDLSVCDDVAADRIGSAGDADGEIASFR